jgi:hypothetical protein
MGIIFLLFSFFQQRFIYIYIYIYITKTFFSLTELDVQRDSQHVAADQREDGRSSGNL